MKAYFNLAVSVTIALAWCYVFTGCFKDNGYKKFKMYTPVYQTSEQVRNQIKSDAPQPVVNPGKMFILGSYIYLNEIEKGVHIIDNSNPSSPVNKAFIHIPGNEDIAVKGNILYADCFTDMMAIDISNPAKVVLKNFLPNLFPERQYVMGYAVPTDKIVTDWVVSDTTVSLSITEGQGIWHNGSYFYNGPYYDVVPGYFYTASQSTGSTKSTDGVAGSASRFAIVNSYLYAVSSSVLNAVNITNTAQPVVANKAVLSISPETIYPFKDKLFIGGTTGIQIYSVTSAEAPVAEAVFGHFCSHDPVIADDNTAYVTLHAGNFCGENVNQLEVLNIQDIKNPVMIKTYPMSSPNGLSKDGDYLFICDAVDGLKVFNAANSTDVKLINTLNVNQPFDVILYNKIAIVSAKDGLYQYNYSNISNIRLLSKIALTKQ